MNANQIRDSKVRSEPAQRTPPTRTKGKNRGAGLRAQNRAQHTARTGTATNNQTRQTNTSQHRDARAGRTVTADYKNNSL